MGKVRGVEGEGGRKGGGGACVSRPFTTNDVTGALHFPHRQQRKGERERWGGIRTRKLYFTRIVV